MPLERGGTQRRVGKDDSCSNGVKRLRSNPVLGSGNGTPPRSRTNPAPSPAAHPRSSSSTLSPQHHLATTPSNNGNGTRHPVGRPPVYNPDKHPRAAYKLVSRHGLAHADLAEAFGVTDGVITQWKQAHPEFLSALNNGWYDWNNPKVKKALSKQATGYFLDEEKVFCNVIDGVARITRAAVKKWYPPVTIATIFWLTNRLKDEWVHTNRMEVSGKIQTQQDPATIAMLKQLLKQSAPEVINTLRESLETIACANTEPC